VCIAGPNGAGKSTLLGVILNSKPFRGECLLFGKSVREQTPRELARQLAHVPQAQAIDFPFSAEQIVLMGRAPYADAMFESPEDLLIAEESMRATDSVAFRDRDVRTLSGGERQRVILAAALAQKPRVMLLDEPTTYLDLRHQIMLYALARDLCKRGVLVLSVTHDLNLAAAYASRVILLHKGSIAADGAPEEVLRPDLLAEVFETDLLVKSTPSGRPWILYGDEAH
jgi:iron complex transport system ATP-binding protein